MRDAAHITQTLQLSTVQIMGTTRIICEQNLRLNVTLQDKNIKKVNDHYANTPMQYTAVFHGCKNVHFLMRRF